jgi:hypothetical protein
MYPNENNGRGCKVKTKQASNERNETSSISHMRGDNFATCSSNAIHCVLNARELAKWLTTSSQSNRVAIRWRGTTYKQCVIDVTTGNPVKNRTIDDDIAHILPREGGNKCKNGNL